MPLHKSLVDEEFWYDEIIIKANNLPDFEREDVDLSSNFTRNIILKNPFVSSPMDTVTGGDMAIAMAALGGIGVIHYNYPTIEEQVEEVRKVKRFAAAFIKDPVCLPITATVGDVYSLKEKYGFFTAPILKEGKLIGLVKRSDIRYIEDRSIPVEQVMTHRDELVVANRKDTLDRMGIKEANRIMRANNLETLPIVDDEDRLVALVTDRDYRRNEEDPLFSLATKNENKQLRVFAAVESRLGLAEPRIMALHEAGCDGIVIDAGVVFKEQIDIAKLCKDKTGMEVVMGSIDSGEMLEKILEIGADYVDAVRAGIGPGASCITQEDLGVGRAPASTDSDCAKKAKELTPKYGFVPVIADGGISNAGDITKALALGANTAMMGSLLAGLEESPGEPEFIDGYYVKRFRGMGSMEAMEQRSAVRYAIEGKRIKIPEGKAMYVPYKGSAYDFIPRLAAAVRQSFLKLGFRDIKELQQGADIIPLHLKQK